MRTMDLKTRVALFTTAIFLCSVWALTWHQANNLLVGVQKLLFDQQYARVQYIANNIDEALKVRLYTLTTLAESITLETMRQPAQMQTLLKSQKPLGKTFSLGLYAVSADGKGIADFPIMPGRADADYSKREYFQEVMRTGKAVIGKPLIGRFAKEPVLLIAVPIMDKAGKIAGVLVGANKIHGNDLFNDVQASSLKLLGDTHIISPQHGIFIASTDPARVLTAIPVLGVNRMFDRYLHGFDGSGLTINSKGIESLSSGSHVTSTGWLVYGTIPTSIAFAPVKKQMNDILRDAAVISLLMAFVVGLFIRQQLAPLRKTTNMLNEMAGGKVLPGTVPVKGAPEISQLLESFNILQQKLEEKETARIQADKARYEQNDELLATEEMLREQNDDLLATEEMLRVQISEYEISQKLLKESEERHHKLIKEQEVILNSSSIGITFVKNRKMVWANPAHCKMFGYEVRETQNMDTAMYYVDRESYEYIGEKAYPIIASGGIFSEEVMMKKKDGSQIWCNLVGQAINPQNMEEGSIWSILDITERKQAEEKRQLLEQQFHQAQKLESLGVLAGGIAHDFNNILTVIMGHCHMARNDMIPEQRYKEAFEKMETAGNRAKDLCRQMLTYAGKSPMEQTLVNLSLLVDEVVKMLQAAIKKNVTIELDLKRDVPEIHGDTGQIQQIIMNLIINSADAIGEANGTIRVVLTKMVFESDQMSDTFGTVIQAGKYACLEVTDTGCGMNEETKKRLFEPFFTTKFTGRGLGMSAIHGIIKSHDGALQLTSKPGVGTTFKIFFPILQPSEHAKTTLTAIVPFEEASGTILFVEDEELLRIMGKELLDAYGFTTMTASNGNEALEIYREHCSEIDVFLLDLVMPVMGGIEAYHELRKINPTVPIIICSGYGVESVEHVIKNDPHAGFIHKPYRPDELRDLLMRMMKGEG